MLEALKAFAATEPQEMIDDEYTLDEVTFKRLFRQLYTIANRYKDVPRGEYTGDNEAYWTAFVRDIGTVANGWELHDAKGKKIIDPSTGACKYHPLFMNVISAILTSYEEIWKARR